MAVREGPIHISEMAGCNPDNTNAPEVWEECSPMAARGVPVDWALERLSKRWNVIDCKHVTAYFVSSGIPVVSIGEVQGRYVDLSTAKQTTDLFYGRLIEGGRKPRPGDLILSRNATVGEVAQVTERHLPFAMGQDVCLLRRRFIDYSPDFLQSIFKSDIISRQLENFMVGSTFRRINVQQVKALVIPFPPVAEQHTIGEVLSDVDELVEALEALIAKKRAIKQAAMQQLLTGKTRLPGFSGEWKSRRIGDLARIQRGASPRPIDSPIWFDENSSIGWVRISDVTSSSTYLRSTTQKLSRRGVRHSRPVAQGSLLMSICATVGRPVITAVDVCIHDGFVVFEKLDIDQLFLYHVLISIEGDWSKYGQKGSQMNLNSGLINRTEIRVPPRDEQAAIAAVLSNMDAEIAGLQERRDKTRAIKQGMMQHLLTGRIRLVKPQPAEAEA